MLSFLNNCASFFPKYFLGHHPASCLRKGVFYSGKSPKLPHKLPRVWLITMSACKQVNQVQRHFFSPTRHKLRCHIACRYSRRFPRHHITCCLVEASSVSSHSSCSPFGSSETQFGRSFFASCPSASVGAASGLLLWNSSINS